MSTPRQRGQNGQVPKGEGIAPTAFGISVIFVLILAIVVIILMVLYFRRDANMINASECPEKVEGLLVKSDQVVTRVASNCGNQADCLFQVTSVQDAVTLCKNLGVDKCKSFSLTQVSNSDVYDMKVSDATTTSISVGTDTYRILA